MRLSDLKNIQNRITEQSQNGGSGLMGPPAPGGYVTYPGFYLPPDQHGPIWAVPKQDPLLPHHPAGYEPPIRWIPGGPEQWHPQISPWPPKPEEIPFWRPRWGEPGWEYPGFGIGGSPI